MGPLDGYFNAGLDAGFGVEANARDSTPAVDR